MTNERPLDPISDAIKQLKRVRESTTADTVAPFKEVARIIQHIDGLSFEDKQHAKYKARKFANPTGWYYECSGKDGAVIALESILCMKHIGITV